MNRLTTDKMSRLKNRLQEILETLNPELKELSKYIYNNPETAFKEYKSSKKLCCWLEKHGFTVERGKDKLNTAFKAQGGEHQAKPVIGFIAEYDALPEIGHACGHNLIATMSVGAAVAVNKLMRESDLEGTVMVLGTPAEESGGGKVMMIREGYFKGLDCAMMIHPASRTMVEDYSLAITQLVLKFHGKPAHTAAFPWKGANALEAVIQTFNQVNAWRCQMRDGSRVHGIITKGGTATNVIPEFCEAKFSVRAPDIVYKDELVERVSQCAHNAAQTMGVEVEIEKEGLSYDPVNNSPVLEDLMATNLKNLGEEVLPRLKDQGIGSTDMGNVTQTIPAIHGHIKIEPDICTHTVEFAKACIGENGQKALLTGAKTMGLTALDILADPALVNKMWHIFRDQPLGN